MESLNRGAFNLISEPLFSLSHGLLDFSPPVNLKEVLSPFSNHGSNMTTSFLGLAGSASASESSLLSKIVKFGSIAAIGGLSYMAWKKYGRNIINKLCGEPEREAVYRWNPRMDWGGGGDVLARAAAQAAARDAEDAAGDAEAAQYDAARAALAARVAAINALADDMDAARALAAQAAGAHDGWSDDEGPEMHVVCEGGDNRSEGIDDYTEYYQLYPEGMYPDMGKGDADLVFDYLDDDDEEEIGEEVDEEEVD